MGWSLSALSISREFESLIPHAPATFRKIPGNIDRAD
jgi:hypothetical protein